MKNFIFLLFSILGFNTLFAQNNNGTNISGDDAGWGDGYNLIYKVDGQIYRSIIYEEGAIITVEPAPTKEGYTFSGWSEIPSTMPANDVEVTGSFSINSYKLVYLVDGKEYKSIIVEYGSKITPEESPTKEGYTFSGWSEIPSTMPANDVEVTGSFTINSYKLVYMVDGKEYKSVTVEYDSKITPEPAPTKEGFTFSGWSGLPEIMPANDVTVIGSFGENTYNLTYKVDGEVYRSHSVVYGSTITPEPAPTKEGFTFSGWSEIPSTMPANDVEVTGSFSINSYELTYIIDGEVYKSVSVEYGSKVKTEPAPSKEGYTFSGWSELPETMPATELKTTGAFIVNKYLLTVLLDGAVYYSDSIAYGTLLLDYLDKFIQNGIDLSQWDYFSEIENISMPAHDVTITAVQSAVKPVIMDTEGAEIYDLTGRRIEIDDITILPQGIYIRGGRKYIVR